MRNRAIIREVVLTTGIETRDVEIIVNATLETIKKNVQAGKRVSLFAFGSFSPKLQPARKGRSSSLGRCGLKQSKPVHIPGRIKPAFKPSKKYFQCTI